jgi:putative ABC transport system permease protein
VVVGFNPRDEVLRIPEVAAHLEALKRPDTALIDVLAQPEFGPRAPGTHTELTDYGHRRVELVGQFELGLGFIAYGMLIVTDKNFVRMIEGRSLDTVSMGLITVRPGADRAATAQRLRAALPEDVQVLSRAAAERKEQDYWTKATSTGVVFGSGVLVACSVGMVVIYNVLSGEVMSRKAEYATLKAMGYADRFLSVVVIQQALLFAVVGYLVGFVSALGFYANTRAQTHVPIAMDLPIAGTTLALTVGMCLGSALVAVRKIKFAEPADLF